MPGLSAGERPGGTGGGQGLLRTGAAGAAPGTREQTTTGIHRLGVVLAAATPTVLGAGVAQAGPRDVQPRPEVAALCTTYGGTASSGTSAWSCRLPDGRTLRCVADGWCTWTRTRGEAHPFLPPTDGVDDDPTASSTPAPVPDGGDG